MVRSFPRAGSTFDASFDYQQEALDTNGIPIPQISAFRQGRDTSEKYQLAVRRQFLSNNLVQNQLRLIQQFGFVHFCSKIIFKNVSTFDEYFNIYGEIHLNSPRESKCYKDYWWVGYSPLEKYESQAL